MKSKYTVVESQLKKVLIEVVDKTQERVYRDRITLASKQLYKEEIEEMIQSFSPKLSMRIELTTSSEVGQKNLRNDTVRKQKFQTEILPFKWTKRLINRLNQPESTKNKEEEADRPTQ